MGPFFMQIARLRIDALIEVCGDFYQKLLQSDRPVIKTALISEYSVTKMPRK